MHKQVDKDVAQLVRMYGKGQVLKAVCKQSLYEVVAAVTAATAAALGFVLTVIDQL